MGNRIEMTADTRYDVFLSHNSADKDAVELLARRLTEETDLTPFLDRWHLIPGQPWQERLEQALAASHTVAVFVGPSGVSPWHNEELRAALDKAMRSRDEYRVIPVLLPGATEESLSDFLARRAWVDFRPGLDDADAFDRLVAGVRGEPPEGPTVFTLPDQPAPYPGLLPFTTQQAEFFFGRAQERNRLLERVRHSPFVAVVGASGSGKSSLVLAGLLPALDENWQVLALVPGARPLRALADQLATLAPPENRLALADELEERLRNRNDGLSTALSALRADRSDIASLLIVVDQFEELFTQVTGTPEEIRRQQQHFIVNLVDAVPNSEGRVRIAITLRADFFPHCLDFEELRAALEPEQESNQLLLGPMGESALREAIARPAQMVGAFFEKGLVARLLDDMRGQPAALPLLGFTLDQLWRRRRGAWLTHAAYDEIGGVAGALNQRAEAIYDRLNTSQQRLARNLFLRLVALGEGAGDTRRRVRRQELELGGADAEQMNQLITELSQRDVRLITADEEAVELSHEALIENWGRLRRWLEADREALLTGRRLTEVANEWAEHGRDDSYLYRGARLAQAEEWAETHTGEMNPLEREFINESIAVRKRAQIQRVAVGLTAVLMIVGALALFALAQYRAAIREGNLAATVQAESDARATAVVIADKEAEAARNAESTAQAESTRAIQAEETAVANAATAVAAEAAAVAERNIAEHRRIISLAQYLLATASRLVERDYNTELATLLTLEANYLNLKEKGNLRAQVDSSLREILGQPYFNTELSGPKGFLRALAFSRDGQRLASGGEDGGVWLWDLSNPGSEPLVLRGHKGQIASVAFSGDGQKLASGSDDDIVRLWDLSNPGSEPLMLRGHNDNVYSVAFNPDGQALASGGGDGTVRLWDLSTPGSEPLVLRGHQGAVYAVAFSPDGQMLASGGDDGTVRLWDMANPASQPVVFGGHSTSIWSVAFSWDGQTLASGSADKTVRLWHLDSPAGEPLVLGDHNGVVFSVAFSPDGQTLALGISDGTVSLRNLSNTESAPVVLSGHDDVVFGVSFSPDGQTLASVGLDGTVRLWDMSPLSVEPLVLSGYNGIVYSVAFSPDGQTLASGVWDGTVWLSDLTSPSSQPTVLSGHENSVSSVDFSRDGRMLASGSVDGTVRLWDLTDLGREPLVLSGHQGAVYAVAFSPDGQMLASGGDDGTVRLWDMADPTSQPVVLTDFQGPVLSLDFSPDGQMLASGDGYGAVRLWDMADPTSQPELLVTWAAMTSLAFSPDGQTLASGGKDNLVRVWDMANLQREPQVLSGHQGVISSVAFSPDGQILASGSEDETVRLWELANLGSEPSVLRGRSGMVFSVAFSPDGQTLASGEWYLTAHLWIVGTDTLAELACQEVRRNLSQAEWAEYLPSEEYRQTCPKLPPGR
jgi:WD40 repeat protein